MLQIKGINIIEEKSELLYHADFNCKSFERDFEITRGQ